MTVYYVTCVIATVIRVTVYRATCSGTLHLVIPGPCRVFLQLFSVVDVYSVRRMRKMCLPDLLYLSSTVPMSIPPLCLPCPGRQQSSDTPLYVASNVSQTNVKGTERLGSTQTGTARYAELVCTAVFAFSISCCF